MEKNNTLINSFYERLKPVRKACGFKMDGYFVWCGSVIKAEDNKYHMFASRWPISTGFPDGYRTDSEIVRAVSDNPEGPYKFKEVVIAGRGGDYWDAQMAHNPTIIKLENAYVLYYLGAKTSDSRTRTIGYAYSNSIEGPWQRIDNNISLMPDSNNPSVVAKPDGTLLLVFRYGDMKLGIAQAKSFDDEYIIVNEDVMPGKNLEDPFIFYNNDHYEMIVEDNGGKVTGHERYGAHLISKDGISDWTVNTPSIAYDHHIKWEDGTETVADRRERPQLLFNQYNNPTHLFTGVKIGEQTFNIAQTIEDTIIRG